MYISDELRVEGRLHSNGEPGGGSRGGAGAGGSIYVVVGHLDGAGSIETVGGAGKINVLEILNLFFIHFLLSYHTGMVYMKYSFSPFTTIMITFVTKLSIVVGKGL